ncbi:serine hydrolase [Atribacter laminatus]|jgi:CubicO group peptidase (beta-lactamase class C family)|uniref:Penicillin-binding protein 4 n=1 Tax=Atribacter laminatus TaxID=2847778 RepID=A0A7T1AMZ1_ATRLM|nr:serine hydrolase [Atribacter laminatus]QPM68891.1 Penicillin-binding protein 4* [Atribacter laminatus]
MRKNKLYQLFVRSSFLMLFVMSCILITSLSVLANDSINHPDQVALQKILADFEAYAEQARKDWGIPGMAISIVQGDEMIYAKGFGVKKVGESDPVDEQTIFQIGSTSKAFTAALVAMMVDEGKFHWKDKVIDYLPDFRMYDPWVTREFLINDVMAQHSGMPGYAGDFLSFLGFDRDYIIHSIRYIQPISSFRSEFAYMNNLFLVAASLVEKASGKTWEDNLQERIFDPLGMNDTTCIQDGFTQALNVAYLHQNIKGQAKMLPMDWPYIDWVYTYSPAGGINSNVVDMAKWMVLQLNEGVYEGKQLISKENIQYMHSPKTILDANNFYNLAWLTTKYEPYSLIWHNGGTSGIKSVIQIIPEAKLGIVVLTNMSDTQLPEALGKHFVDLYFGNPLKDWSAESLKAFKTSLSQEAEIPDIPKEKPLPLEAYTGKYVNPVFGEILISIEGENLVFAIGPKQSKVILTPWNRDTFLFSIPDFLDEGGFVQFQIDPMGKAYKFVDDTIGEFDRIAD